MRRKGDWKTGKEMGRRVLGTGSQGRGTGGEEMEVGKGILENSVDRRVMERAKIGVRNKGVGKGRISEEGRRRVDFEGKGGRIKG